MKSIYSKQAKKIRVFLAFLKVGATGFEPATTCSQNRSATGLRYTPLHTFAITYRNNQVGATGFEPATTCSQNRSATGLRYTPLRTYAICYQRRKSRGDRIRTCDHLFPKQERYRTALHPASFSQQLIFVSISIISELRVQRYDFFSVPPNF